MARASTSARSRVLTMSWSRSAGESSRRATNASTPMIKPTIPHKRNWNCQPGWASNVWLVTW